MRDNPPERTFVLGLDGVPWDLLSKWASQGELPNFHTMMEEGASGPLRSTMPPTTALAWPSIATGVQPDKHGIYSFRELTESYTHEMNTSNDVQQPTLWDILSPALVGNVPMTYPAREIEGKLVTGMMTPSMDGGFTHPPELAEEIEAKIPEYDIGLSWKQYHDRKEEFLEDLSNLLAARRRLMRHLMETEEWELFFFVYTEPDRLQHLIWDEEVILEHYKELDDILSEVMEFVESNDANLFVVSDHGFMPISNFVNVNTVLEENGLLQRKDGGGMRQVFSSLGVNKQNVRRVLQQLRIEGPLLKILPSNSINTFARTIPGEHSLFDIDYPETEAFGYAKRNVYVNDTERFDDGVVDPDDIPEIKARVEEAFSSVRDPESEERLLDIYDGDELFPSDRNAPDLIVKGINQTEENTNLSDIVIEKSGGKAGAHHHEGIVFAWGPNICEGAEISDATVYDIAPTVLHSLNKHIPANADGELLEIFEEDSPPARSKITTRNYGTANGNVDHSNDFDEVEDRLQGLGYI